MRFDSTRAARNMLGEMEENAFSNNGLHSSHSKLLGPRYVLLPPLSPPPIPLTCAAYLPRAAARTRFRACAVPCRHYSPRSPNVETGGQLHPGKVCSVEDPSPLLLPPRTPTTLPAPSLHDDFCCGRVSRQRRRTQGGTHEEAHTHPRHIHTHSHTPSSPFSLSLSLSHSHTHTHTHTHARARARAPP
jgi:hypothetical protein